MKFNKIYVVLLALALCFYRTTYARQNKQMVRIAKLVIDSNQLESYKAALTEEIRASVRLEPKCSPYMLL